MAFHIKEDQAQQLLQYEVVVGAYLQVDTPRQLSAEALTLLIPAAMAEQARLHSTSYLHTAHLDKLWCRQHVSTSGSWCMQGQAETRHVMWLPVQALHLEPQGRCLNDANARRGRRPRPPAQPAPGLPTGASLQDLCTAYQSTGIAFLDLQKMRVQLEAGIRDAGPAACLAGSLQLVPGQLGTASQASTHTPQTLSGSNRLKTAESCIHACGLYCRWCTDWSCGTRDSCAAIMRPVHAISQCTMRSPWTRAASP